MLVLSRKSQESIVVGDSGTSPRLLKVTVLGIHGGKVRLGFEAHSDVAVHRMEVWEDLCARAGPDGLDPLGTAPVTSLAGGTAFSGKFAARYVAAVSTWSCGSSTIVSISAFHPSFV